MLQCKQLRHIIAPALGQQKKILIIFALANGKGPGSSLVEDYLTFLRTHPTKSACERQERRKKLRAALKFSAGLKGRMQK